MLDRSVKCFPCTARNINGTVGNGRVARVDWARLALNRTRMHTVHATRVRYTSSATSGYPVFVLIIEVCLQLPVAGLYICDCEYILMCMSVIGIASVFLKARPQ